MNIFVEQAVFLESERVLASRLTTFTRHGNEDTIGTPSIDPQRMSAKSGYLTQS